MEIVYCYAFKVVIDYFRLDFTTLNIKDYIMKIEELERLIEAQAETISLDFKANSPWAVKNFGRDMLAMSNVRDGGTIVIGVEEIDNKFVRKGVSTDNIETYKVDIMKDQLLKYADPPIDFTVSFPTDSNGLHYVVIKVFPFKEMPTICKRTLDKELIETTIYYRNTNRRIESAAISNSTDLRDIIELAAVRLMQKRKSFGYILPESDFELFKKEIDTITESPVVKKIKSKGFIEVKFVPNKAGNIASLSECLEIIKKAEVRKYWVLPWIPNGNPGQGELYPVEAGYQAESDLGSRIEFWRFFQSEQFYMLNSIVEDWYAEDVLRQGWAQNVPPGKYLSLITSIVHYITQVFAFLERLAFQGLYKEGVNVTITYYNTKGREIYVDSSKRTSFITPKITQAAKIEIKGDYSQQEILEDSTKFSNDFILKVLDYFGYKAPSESIQIEQLEFLNGR